MPPGGIVDCEVSIEVGKGRQVGLFRVFGNVGPWLVLEAVKQPLRLASPPDPRARHKQID